MKDLKHLIYFEKLLTDAHNELVRKAVDEGQHAIGYTCFHIPEVLLNLDNCFSIRLRAPSTGSMEIATYYMSNYSCEFARAILERSFEGGYNFLGGYAAAHTCEAMNRSIENVEIMKLIENNKFFLAQLDVPFYNGPDECKLYEEQITRKILKEMERVHGTDISDASIRRAVKLHNEVCRIITEIGEYRKEENPRITGYEFHILCLVSYTCPKALIVDKLRETLEELKTRKPDVKKKYRAKIVLVGSEIDDPELTRLIEDSGALVVADRYCYGSFPGRQEIVLTDDKPALTQICQQYLDWSLCPRFMMDKVESRHNFYLQLVKDFHADGIIFEAIKFCTYWGYERALSSHIVTAEKGIPSLMIDRPYLSRSSGQLRTRVQAFVESLEIKKINKKEVKS